MVKTVMVKKCVCYISYEDGSIDILTVKLKHGGPFSLEEAEGWLVEQSEKSVKTVRCAKTYTDLIRGSDGKSTIP